MPDTAAELEIEKIRDTLSTVKVDELNNTLVEVQTKALMDALADTQGDVEAKSLSQHFRIWRRKHCLLLCVSPLQT